MFGLKVEQTHAPKGADRMSGEKGKCGGCLARICSVHLVGKLKDGKTSTTSRGAY